jgi:hypothetical protein
VNRLTWAPLGAWLAAALSVALAVPLAVLAPVVARGGEVSGDDVSAFVATIAGAIGVVLLVAALAVGARDWVGPAVGVLLGAWAAALLGAGPTLRIDYLLAGAALLIVAEVAYWSIDRRSAGAGSGTAPRATATRARDLAVLLLASCAAGWLLAGLVVRAPGGGGLDALGVLAAVAFAVAVARLATASEG